MQASKVTMTYETFKATYYKDDQEGVIVFYRKNSNGEFHRAIKITKKELLELTLSIKGNDDEL